MDPTTSEVAQPMPEGTSRIEHVLVFAILGIKPTISLHDMECHMCH